jgi:hypothetical protein
MDKRTSRIGKNRTVKAFIEVLRSPICQRCKNNLMTVSNGQLADVAVFLILVLIE